MKKDNKPISCTIPNSIAIQNELFILNARMPGAWAFAIMPEGNTFTNALRELKQTGVIRKLKKYDFHKELIFDLLRISELNSPELKNFLPEIMQEICHRNDWDALNEIGKISKTRVLSPRLPLREPSALIYFLLMFWTKEVKLFGDVLWPPLCYCSAESTVQLWKTLTGQKVERFALEKTTGRKLMLTSSKLLKYSLNDLRGNLEQIKERNDLDKIRRVICPTQ